MWIKYSTYHKNEVLICFKLYRNLHEKIEADALARVSTKFNLHGIICICLRFIIIKKYFCGFKFYNIIFVYTYHIHIYESP